MKIRLLIILFCLFICPAMTIGQSVVISKKTVTYKRSKPIVDFKKTFTVNYPKVKASTPALSRKIEAAISYDANLEIRIKDELGETQWLENADYEVGYNKNGILSIALTIEGTGAYPDGSTKHVVVNLLTGAKAKPVDAFTNLKGLLAMVDRAKDREVAAAIMEVKKDPEYADADIENMFKESEKYNKVTLDEFSVSGEGITFYHNYGFAHVAEAVQPAGEFMFTWKQLKPFIKLRGLLGQFVR